MNTQNLKTDKLDLMGWIYSVQDVSIIETLKEIQKTAVLSDYESSLKPMLLVEQNPPIKPLVTMKRLLKKS
jgi:hypothetical protein